MLLKRPFWSHWQHTQALSQPLKGKLNALLIVLVELASGRLKCLSPLQIGNASAVVLVNFQTAAILWTVSHVLVRTCLR